MKRSSILGLVNCRLTSADVLDTLLQIQKTGIFLYDIQQLDALTVTFLIRYRDQQTLGRLCKDRGERIRFYQVAGIHIILGRMLRRPILLLGCVLLLLLSLWLPGRVLFVQVEGNEHIPGRLIAEKASQCGIGFGASRREVRSEQMKNALLEAMPQLQWAGVNTDGCVAVISVRERDQAQQQIRLPGSIVALRSGIITELTVTAGTPLVRPGQAVMAGQVLISGYTDLGTHLRYEGAEGEVFANTIHQIHLLSPSGCVKRVAMRSSRTRHSLLIGKKQINFYNNSGILDMTCVKIYKENYIMLPGGFQLPVAWVTEEYIYYTETADRWQYTQTELRNLCRQYLQQQMIAGTILEASFTSHPMPDVYRIDGIVHCHEWIGLVRTEEMDNQYGEDH